MSRRLFRILTPVLCLAGLAGHGLAQGANDCGSATPISGLATFNVTTVGATNSTQQSGACPTAYTDVWFKWTATATQAVEVATCGASIDTVLAVYAGSVCPAGASLVCNDDFCGLQSTVPLNAVSGTTYMIQIGAYTAGQTFTGTFTIGTPAPSGCANPSTGPDVIVGDLNGVENEATAGTLDAISLGTTSCNIGTANVAWVAGNNLHPVIGGNLYRYRVVSGAGRFEQIGQSWLKHGFTALTQNLCCTCSGQGGAVLGVGCADPYTAGRNGSQSGLGPRNQVNAHTGVFTYPPANPAWSGATARRCEFLQSDVDLTAGVRYIAETHYVTQDDATAGNQNNNASYREVSVSGGPTNFTFAFVGATQRMMSAIRAWPVVEPTVTLNDVQVAGDGLYIVGFKTTSLGGGQYHYEYAVYNMNGDRNCGSFSIPVGAGVTVTNIGFHDVDYRNGDGGGSVNYAGTDWVGSVSGGALTWACETQAVNANANAIRWGTTYNFRFDANVAPATGTATLGLWKTVTSVTTNVDVPGAGSTNFAFCFGDGSGTVCPCGNNATVGSGTGCLNSLGQGGLLAATGNASISGDTLALVGSGMPNSSALYYQGTTQQSGGAGSIFGDGKRCAAGTVIRLGTKNNTAGTSQYPVGADLKVSVKGANVAGNVRTYQCWYRNAAAFCNPETFNVSNGYQVTWAP